VGGKRQRNIALFYSTLTNVMGEKTWP